MRTYWRRHEEQKDEIMEEEPVEWWEEQHVGYAEDGEEEPEFQWSDDVKRGNNDVDGDNDKEDDREEHDHDDERV